MGLWTVVLFCIVANHIAHTKKYLVQTDNKKAVIGNATKKFPHLKKTGVRGRMAGGPDVRGRIAGIEGQDYGGVDSVYSFEFVDPCGPECTSQAPLPPDNSVEIGGPDLIPSSTRNPVEEVFENRTTTTRPATNIKIIGGIIYGELVIQGIKFVTQTTSSSITAMKFWSYQWIYGISFKYGEQWIEIVPPSYTGKTTTCKISDINKVEVGFGGIIHISSIAFSSSSGVICGSDTSKVLPGYQIQIEIGHKCKVHHIEGTTYEDAIETIQIFWECDKGGYLIHPSPIGPRPGIIEPSIIPPTATGQYFSHKKFRENGKITAIRIVGEQWITLFEVKYGDTWKTVINGGQSQKVCEIENISVVSSSHSKYYSALSFESSTGKRCSYGGESTTTTGVNVFEQSGVNFVVDYFEGTILDGYIQSIKCIWKSVNGGSVTIRPSPGLPESPVIYIVDPIGPERPKGIPFDDWIYFKTYGEITAFQIIGGQQITGFKIKYGSTWVTHVWPENDNRNRECLITEVHSAKVGNGGNYISSLTFISKSATCSSNTNGETVETWQKKNCKLGYFTGSATNNYLESLQAIMTCTETGPTNVIIKPGKIFGVNEGDKFDDNTYVINNARITAVEIKSRYWVYSIRVRYGEQWVLHGKGGGLKSTVCEISDITRVEGGFGDDYLSRISFHSSGSSCNSDISQLPDQTGIQWVEQGVNCVVHHLTGTMTDKKIQSIQVYWECQPDGHLIYPNESNPTPTPNPGPLPTVPGPYIVVPSIPLNTTGEFFTHREHIISGEITAVRLGGEKWLTLFEVRYGSKWVKVVNTESTNTNKICEIKNIRDVSGGHTVGRYSYLTFGTSTGKECSSGNQQIATNEIITYVETGISATVHYFEGTVLNGNLESLSIVWKSENGAVAIYPAPPVKFSNNSIEEQIVPPVGPQETKGVGFSDQKYYIAHGEITAIDLRANKWVTGFRVKYGNTWVNHGWQKNYGSQECSISNIQSVQTRHMNNGQYFLSIQLTSETQTCASPTNNVSPGGNVEKRSLAGCKIGYFSGSVYENYLESLQVHFICPKSEPIKPPQPGIVEPSIPGPGIIVVPPIQLITKGTFFTHINERNVGGQITAVRLVGGKWVTVFEVRYGKKWVTVVNKDSSSNQEICEIENIEHISGGLEMKKYYSYITFQSKTQKVCTSQIQHNTKEIKEYSVDGKACNLDYFEGTILDGYVESLKYIWKCTEKGIVIVTPSPPTFNNETHEELIVNPVGPPNPNPLGDSFHDLQFQIQNGNIQAVQFSVSEKGYIEGFKVQYGSKWITHGGSYNDGTKKACSITNIISAQTYNDLEHYLSIKFSTDSTQCGSNLNVNHEGQMEQTTMSGCEIQYFSGSVFKNVLQSLQYHFACYAEPTDPPIGPPNPIGIPFTDRPQFYSYGKITAIELGLGKFLTRFRVKYGDHWVDHGEFKEQVETKLCQVSSIEKMEGMNGATKYLSYITITSEGKTCSSLSRLTTPGGEYWSKQKESCTVKYFSGTLLDNYVESLRIHMKCLIINPKESNNGTITDIIGPNITHGIPFNDIQYQIKYGNINAVKLAGDKWLTGFTVRYGDHWSDHGGVANGVRLDLCEIENIVGIEGRYGAEKYHSFLSFTSTNSKKCTSETNYLTKGGTPWEKVHEGCTIKYFRGTTLNTYLESLTIVWDCLITEKPVVWGPEPPKGNKFTHKEIRNNGQISAIRIGIKQWLTVFEVRYGNKWIRHGEKNYNDGETIVCDIEDINKIEGGYGAVKYYSYLKFTSTNNQQCSMRLNQLTQGYTTWTETGRKCVADYFEGTELDTYIESISIVWNCETGGEVIRVPQVPAVTWGPIPPKGKHFTHREIKNNGEITAIRIGIKQWLTVFEVRYGNKWIRHGETNYNDGETILCDIEDINKVEGGYGAVKYHSYLTFSSTKNKPCYMKMDELTKGYTIWQETGDKCVVDYFEGTELDSYIESISIVWKCDTGGKVIREPPGPDGETVIVDEITDLGPKITHGIPFTDEKFFRQHGEISKIYFKSDSWLVVFQVRYGDSWGLSRGDSQRKGTDENCETSNISEVTAMWGVEKYYSGMSVTNKNGDVCQSSMSNTKPGYKTDETKPEGDCKLKFFSGTLLNSFLEKLTLHWRCIRLRGSNTTIVDKPEIGIWRGPEGDVKFSHKNLFLANGPISAVQLKGGLWLEGFRVRYGEKWSEYIGQTAGFSGSNCEISDIIRVNGRYGDVADYFSALAFESQSNKKCISETGNILDRGETPVHFSEYRDGCVLNFVEGTTFDKYLSSVRLHWDCGKDGWIPPKEDDPKEKNPEISVWRGPEGDKEFTHKDLYAQNGPITAVKLKGGSWLEGFRVRYGTKWSDYIGQTAGISDADCEISDIIQVDGRYGDSEYYFSALSFQSEKKKKCASNTAKLEKRGTPVEFSEYKKGCTLKYVEGTTLDNYISSVRLIWNCGEEVTKGPSPTLGEGFNHENDRKNGPISGFFMKGGEKLTYFRVTYGKVEAKGIGSVGGKQVNCDISDIVEVKGGYEENGYFSYLAFKSKNGKTCASATDSLTPGYKEFVETKDGCIVDYFGGTILDRYVESLTIFWKCD